MDDFNTVVHTLTEGLRDLPTDDVARVRHFLTEYLGSSRHPVPFGGREKDFARLDAWLGKHEVPAYMLLAAPAGRGKSALLLRWCQQLLAQPELAVVYFPVSIRFRTNLAGVVFPALVALLARLHGESIPSDPHTQEEVWRGLLNEYLTRPLPGGRQLVLVLDGVDEAADWIAGPDLLPAEPPPGLHVAISARYLANDHDASDWLRRLGWTRQGLAGTLELYPLDRAGITSVLLQMGFPVDLLGSRIDIVSELHRLSEGDPLLIRLYVDDLWERGEAVVRLQPDDLRAIRPGLVGYFERWWNDQRLLWSDNAPEREAIVQSVLNLLAGALGPLSKTDILNLAPREAGLNDENFEQHLGPLARFVIGDGMRQGYVFSHPRLASYFLEERLSAPERQEVERRFLSWGAKTLNALNDGHLAPEQASAYIVQYYGAHLERAQADTSDLLALVSDGWRLAWEKLDRANAGFLGDGERAWRAAEREDAAAIEAGQPAPYLGAEIRSLLCRVSINSMTSNISSRLMLEAVKTGIWTPAQGLACIRLITDPTPRARELVGLAPYVQEPLRTDILQEALDTLAALKDERARLDALVELAPGFSEGLLGQILSSVSTIEDEADRAGMLADLAASIAPYHRLVEQALDIAQEIEEEEYLALALAGLAPCLSAEQHEPVLQVALAMQNERYRAQALVALIPHLPGSLLQEIVPEAYRMWDILSQARLLAELVRALPDQARNELLQEALKLLSEIIDQEYRVELLVRLAPRLPEDRLLQALPEIQALWDESQRARALNELLPLWPAEHLAEFLQAVQAMKNEEQSTTILRQLLPHLPETLLESAIETIQATWDEGRRAELLATLAPSATEALLPRLLELIKEIEDPGYRIWLLAELETSLSGTLSALPFDIVQTFQSMKDAEERLQTLLAIAPRLSDEVLAKIFNFMLPEIFNFRWAVQDVDRQAQILSKLGPRLPAGRLREVIYMVRAMRSEIYQAQVLVALAPRLPEKLLPDVLAIVQAIQGREKRAPVLEALVASLPAERKGERVREILQVLQIIKDEGERASLAVSFINVLPGIFPAQQMQVVLKAVQALRSEIHQAGILAALAPHVPEQMLAEMLQIVQKMRSEEERARVLEALAPRLPERHLSTFLAVTQTIQHKRWRAQVLAKMASHASKENFAEILDLVYQKRQDEDEQALILSALAPHAPEDSFPQLWHAIQRIKTPRWRAWILGSLTYVPETFFPQVWEAIQDIKDEGWRLRSLATLASSMSENFFPRLWQAVQEIADERQRMRAISTLAPYVPEQFFSQVFWTTLELSSTRAVREAEMHVRALEGEKQVNALEILAQRVPESFFPQFWNAVNGLQDQWRQEGLQVLLAAHVPEKFFATVWETVNNDIEQWQQTRMLEALALRVPDSFFPQFWETVKSLEYQAKQLQIIKLLIPHLSHEQLEGVLDIAQTSSNLHLHIVLLKTLASYLSQEQSLLMLKMLYPLQQEEQHSARKKAGRETWQMGERVQYLIELAPRLPERQFLALLPRLFQAARLMQSDGERAVLLIGLAPRVPEDALPEMIELLWLIEMAPMQQEVLAVLLPALTQSGWTSVLELASARTRKTGNVRFLAQILQAAGALAQPPSPALLYPALRDLLPLLAQDARRDALTCLAPLAGAIYAASGETAALEACCAVMETGYWWP